MAELEVVLLRFSQNAAIFDRMRGMFEACINDFVRGFLDDENDALRRMGPELWVEVREFQLVFTRQWLPKRIMAWTGYPHPAYGPWGPPPQMPQQGFGDPSQYPYGGLPAGMMHPATNPAGAGGKGKRGKRGGKGKNGKGIPVSPRIAARGHGPDGVTGPPLDGWAEKERRRKALKNEASESDDDAERRTPGKKKVEPHTQPLPMAATTRPRSRSRSPRRTQTVHVRSLDRTYKSFADGTLRPLSNELRFWFAVCTASRNPTLIEVLPNVACELVDPEAEKLSRRIHPRRRKVEKQNSSRLQLRIMSKLLLVLDAKRRTELLLLQAWRYQRRMLPKWWRILRSPRTRPRMLIPSKMTIFELVQF